VRVRGKKGVDGLMSIRYIGKKSKLLCSLGRRYEYKLLEVGGRCVTENIDIASMI
jgi:hypothetical protein